MSFSPRQLAAVALMAVCMVVAVLVCLFAPVQVGLIAVLVTVGVCTAIVLLFLRKVLSAVYRLGQNGARRESETSRSAGRATEREIALVNARLERIEEHLPERLAARIAFELARPERDAAGTPAAGSADL
ncbi:hypothetical protein [Isoptericola sp. NPDC056134]|uniref:hypothetical protein n=1 Tax=unclassified Isoptericola TaxID=2623355 RepID=UPI0035E6BFCB